MPKVSVVIPSFNHSKFIIQAIESILVQRAELEIIVVDDGSKDDSIEVLKKFEHLSSFKLVSQENQGAHAAINRGLGLATGEYVAILNSDDFYHPHRFKTLLQNFEEDPKLDLIVTGLDVVDANSKRVATKIIWGNLLPWGRPLDPVKLHASTASHQIFGLNLIFTNFTSTSSNLFFKRRLIDEGMKMKNLRYAHDWDFVLEAWQKFSCKAIPDSLMSYRVHAGNTLKENRLKINIEVVYLIKEYFEKILEMLSIAHPPLKTDSVRHELQRVIREESWQGLVSEIKLAKAKGRVDLEAIFQKVAPGYTPVKVLFNKIKRRVFRLFHP